ncbi:MAG: leucine-rich repeat domain-containing protein [Spirochaetaceae bacterium]|jgi:hypothetical protein|nr:leucine-rich repeat domain-containing protein [Spirochaetaceae bacterium]
MARIAKIKLLLLIPISIALSLLLISCFYYIPDENGDTYVNVTYIDPSGGPVPIDNTQYKQNESILIMQMPENNLTREDGTIIFAGWKLKDAYTIDGEAFKWIYLPYNYFEYESEESHSVTDITFVAVWQEFYQYDGQTISGVNWPGWDGVPIKIPAQHNGQAITAIAEGVFARIYYNILSISFPETITTISKSAFRNSSFYLSKLSIPQHISTIEEYAFSNCWLSDVTLPPNLTSLATKAFANNNIEIITIPASLTTIPEDAFAENPIRSILLESNVNIANDDAFGNNGETFNTYYSSKGKAAGLYLYHPRTAWTGPYTKRDE